MQFDELRMFERVAVLGSFTRAAEHLGLAKGRVSAAVQQLESSVGTRLLQRTTRQVKLTPDGEAFLGRCQELLADAEQLHAMFQPAASGLQGRLRIDLPATLARELVIPRLPEFLAAHPLLEVALSTTDRRVDPVQEGFDCVLRVGTLHDAELVARPLGHMAMCNLASPAYLRRHGMPRTLADLADLAGHRLVHYAGNLSLQGAGFEHVEDGVPRLLPMRSSLVVNGTDAYQAACLAGLGIIQAPVHGTRALVQAGQLVPLLPQHTAPAMPVSLLYPHRRHLAPRVQAVLQWLAQLVSPWLAAMTAQPEEGKTARRRPRKAG